MPQSHSSDPVYQDCDDTGLPAQSRKKSPSAKDWRVIDSDFARRILSVFNMTRYPTKAVRSSIHAIQGGVKSGLYPQGWIEAKIAWVTGERMNQHMVPIQGLLSAIQNTALLQQWKERNGLSEFNKPDVRPGYKENYGNVEDTVQYPTS